VAFGEQGIGSKLSFFKPGKLRYYTEDSQLMYDPQAMKMLLFFVNGALAPLQSA
jgi:hypothetical protein